MLKSLILVLVAMAFAASVSAADGKQVVYIAGYGSTISCFTLDAAAGTLAPLSTSEGGNNPSYLAWDPSKRFMYAINEGDPGKVIAFAIDPATGALKKINEAAVAVGGACHIACHPGGKWVIATNYGSGHIVVLPVKADGGVGDPLPSLPPGKRAHQSVFDATGSFFFVPFLGDELIAQYRFDAASGALTPNTPPSVATKKGAGPRHMVFSADGKAAYGINELDSTLTSYAYDAAKGTLTAQTTVPTLPADFKGRNSTAHILVSPDGKFVYGSNRGHNSIAIFKTGAGGALTFVGHETGGGEIKVPRDFGMTPDGGLVIVANQDGGNVTVFKRDAAAGTLSKVSTVAVPGKPAFVGIVTLP